MIEETRINTKQHQQHYSKWTCLQLSRAEFNGSNTNRELKSELAELKMKGKYMLLLAMFLTVQQY